jgi:hypothetical protein
MIMIKKVKQQVTGTNNYSTMETETIQKNGASPKSQISRGQYEILKTTKY